MTRTPACAAGRQERQRKTFAPLGALARVETPAVLVDLGRAEANIAKLQTYCDEHGLANRPHIKTHKLPLLAHKQLAAGAAGITVQTLGEAEVMVAAGIDDVLLTYNPMGEAKAVRLARLALQARMRVALDNEVALATVARAAAPRRAGDRRAGRVRVGQGAAGGARAVGRAGAREARR